MSMTARKRRVAVGALSLVVLAACASAEEVALGTFEDDAAASAAPETPTTDDADADDPEGGGAVDGDQADDPLQEIAWALPPAGPESPSVNEDTVYKVLDNLDPEGCAALLEPDAGWFDPTTFGTGERSVHLFRAGAHLCAGDRAQGEAAYQQAIALTWPFAVEQPLHSRVCNVWDAVTRMVDPDAGPCALEELTFDTSDASEPTASGSEGASAPEDDGTRTTGDASAPPDGGEGQGGGGTP